MKIITVPHPTLRQTAAEVKVVDKKLKKFVKDLQETLAGTRNPPGVGLAATQVNDLHRVFATYLDKQLKSYINPAIINRSERLELGQEGEDPYYEGCLSIPGVYGPVPRHQWVDLRFQEIDGESLVTKEQRFTDFAARVVQHELDHLDGILFIDYSLKLNLPLFKENKKTKKFEEIDPSPFQYV